MSTYVYFVRPIGLPGPVKIGWSQSPVGRLETLMSWSPFPLEIIGHVPGTMKDEGYLHRCFWQQRSHGEWFHHSSELQVAIDRVLTLGVVPRDIVPVDILESRPGRQRGEESKLKMSYIMRVDWALRKMRTEDGYFRAPSDVQKILSDWSGHYRQGAVRPTAEQFERLEAYLNDPSVGAIFQRIARRVA